MFPGFLFLFSIEVTVTGFTNIFSITICPTNAKFRIEALWVGRAMVCSECVDQDDYYSLK